MALRIAVDHEQLASFCRANGIRRLAFYGSVLRDDFRPESDVDVLVEFQTGERVGFFRLFDIEEGLSALLSGRKVDLATPKALHPLIRDEVLTTAEVQYGEP